MRAERRGMTLIELIAAIAIAGLVLLGAVLLLDVVNDNAARLRREALTGNESTRETLQVERLLADASIDGDSTERFAGDARGVSFWTRCATSRGWSARCQSTLTLVDDRGGTVLRASGTGGERVVGRYRDGTLFQYFDVDHEAWRASWNASATLPAALAIISGDDSTIYSVGPARD